MALNRHHARLKTLFAGTPAYDYRQLPPPSLGPLVSLQSVLSDWHRTPVLLPDLRQLRVLANDFVQRYVSCLRRRYSMCAIWLNQAYIRYLWM